jgi:hypothetical protein
MSTISEAYIRCDRCSSSFRCPFPIPDTKTFSYAVLWGMRVRCRTCETTIHCDATNMSYICDHAGANSSPQALSIGVAKAAVCWLT